MSWHNIHRTTLISQAVLASLLGTTGLAHAINLGQADIQSAQHEPLSAIIEVSDIDAKNFNASLATPDIYRQLGLDANAKISVTFTPTSATSGKIKLSSNTPISAPFTDVVLNLNDNGKQLIEAQTLLMPLPKSGTFKLPEQNSEVITTEVKQNLPVVTDIPTDDTATVLEADNTTDVATQNHDGLAKDDIQVNTPANTKKSSVELAPEGIDTQTQILTEQITRHVYPAGQAPKELTNQPTSEEVVASTQETSTKTDNSDDITTPPSGKAVYVVQSGDSLWSIANQIAKANNMSVDDVMKAIHTANPDAFNHGKMNQLKTNANLNLPDYDVIPSQKAIQEAIHAKRSQHKGQAGKKTTHKKSGGHSQNMHAKTSSQHGSHNAHKKPAKQALPKAQVTLVTPTQQGKATGTNTKAVKNATTGGDSNLVGTLKQTRQQTASNAKQVNSLNRELSSATQKLQLQNQKLAELESRLKALKDKK